MLIATIKLKPIKTSLTINKMMANILKRITKITKNQEQALTAQKISSILLNQQIFNK